MFPPRPGSGSLIAPPGVPASSEDSVAQALFLEARRRRRRRWLAGAATVVVAGAVAISAVTWIPGLSGRGTGHAGGPGAALAGRSSALSGHAAFTWRVSTAGIPVAHGTDDVTFTGKNRITTYTRTDLHDGLEATQSQSGVERVVGGQIYDQFRVRGQLRWVHSMSSALPDIKVPNPRILLSVLEPYTPFQAVGYQVIGGVRLKVLRATNPGGLTHRDLLPVLWTSDQHVGSLEMWVDGRGVVQRMTYTFRFPAGIAASQPASQAAVRKYQQAQRAFSRLLGSSARSHRIPRRRITLAERRMNQAMVRAYPVKHGTQVTTTTLIFSSIGQPQHITVPLDALSNRAFERLVSHH
jgi:hypothetical protein